MNIHKPKDTLTVVVVFLVPVMLVKGGAILLGSGPAQARGSNVTPVDRPPLVLTPTEPEWTELQQAAARHVVDLQSQPFGNSPFLHLEVAQPDVPDVDPQVTRREVPPPDVVVQAILIRRDGNHVALIGRKRFRTGDPIGEEGWFIKTIDGHSRSVLIEHPETERTATLSVPLPR
jgi:hypothetical protein